MKRFDLDLDRAVADAAPREHGVNGTNVEPLHRPRRRGDGLGQQLPSEQDAVPFRRVGPGETGAAVRTGRQRGEIEGGKEGGKSLFHHRMTLLIFSSMISSMV